VGVLPLQGALDNQRFAVDGSALPLVAMAIPFTLFGGVLAMIGWALTGVSVV